MKRTLLLLFTALFIPAFIPAGAAQTPNAWINEIHYDNTGADADEFVEIALENAARYDLSAFDVVLYNGSSSQLKPYGTDKTLDEYTEGDTEGAYTLFYYNYTEAGHSIQNGAPDGLALFHDGEVLQFISYEGYFTAAEGLAAGMTSVDIGVGETGSTPAGASLQLTGAGATSADFAWTGPAPATPGLPNEGQTFEADDGDDLTCPGGTNPVATYAWDGSGFVFDATADDAEDAIAFSNIVLDDGAPTMADWTSDGTGIAAVVVKGGTMNTTTYTPATTSGTVTNEGLSRKAISNARFCTPPGDCPQSYIQHDEIVRQPVPDKGIPGRFEVVFTNDSERIHQVDFIDEDGALDLENLVVAEAPDGFAANDSKDLSWSYVGSGEAPRTVRFVLEQADVDNLQSRYFARLSSACGSTIIDPPVDFVAEPDRPEHVALKRSYPNPSAGAVTIGFELPAPARVRLGVYDVMGRKVATLVDRAVPAGTHEVRWEGRTSSGQPVASGVYFYRLKAGATVRTERLTVIR